MQNRQYQIDAAIVRIMKGESERQSARSGDALSRAATQRAKRWRTANCCRSCLLSSSSQCR